jgi:predicted ArsR family transcriptional regulator
MSSNRRRLTDPRELRALSHPTRLALLELLDTDGPMTATQAGELLGESPASASFHLRTLAKHGFVEEAPGGRGRQRPWRITPEAQEIREEDLSPAAKIAAGAFLELLRGRDVERLRQWTSTRQHYPTEWREAATEMRLSVHLTPAELAGLTKAIEDVMAPYLERESRGERPAGALPVSFGLHAVPMRPPAAAGEEES